MKQATVFMNNFPVGRLSKTESGTYLFAYNEAYLNNDNLPPLSLTLPKQKEVFESEELFPFFYSLLSEGANKKAQCFSQKIDERDDFALQEGLGITEKTDTYIHTGHPTITDFVQFGKECEMTDRQIITTMAPFMKNQEAVYLICDESEMTEKSKRIYLRGYERRLAFLQRDCSALHKG